MYVGMSLYILMEIFCCVCLLQFCTQWCAYLHMPGLYGLGWKWLPFANVSNFLYSALQMIIILNETKAAVQPCLPSMIYAAKLWIWATITVVQLCATVQNTLQRGWLKHSNRMQIALACKHGVSCLGKDTLQKSWPKHSNKVHIALACWHSGHRVSFIHGARVVARHFVCCCPWLQSFVVYCCHSFCTCNT